MKTLPFFIVFCLLVSGLGAETPAGLSFPEIFFGTTLSFLPKTETVKHTDTLRLEHPLAGVFVSGAFTFAPGPDPEATQTTVKSELAGKLNFGPVATVSGGNLVKSNALSRLAYPLSSSYTSAISQPALPSSGFGSAMPHSAGSHPKATAAHIRFPVIPAVELDLYTNENETQGMSASIPLNFAAPWGKTSLRVTSSAYG
jgi:hypothetical protein